MSFLNILFDPSIPFIRYALIAGLLSSLSLGMIGSHVVVNRISYIAGAISHAAMAGIGAALYFSAKTGTTWFTPLMGAFLAAVISGTIIAFVSFYVKEREDTIIGTVWALGMSIGIVFLAITPGYIDPMSYLFGNILLINQQDLIMIFILDIVVIVLSIVFYNLFEMISFDRDFAVSRGIKTFPVYLLLILLISLTTVIMSSIVGIVMVIALLTIPAATAGLLTKKLWQMMIIASIISAASTTGGLVLSYSMDLPSGALSIIMAAIIYLVCTLGKYFVIRRKKNER